MTLECFALYVEVTLAFLKSRRLTVLQPVTVKRPTPLRMSKNKIPILNIEKQKIIFRVIRLYLPVGLTGRVFT